MKRLFARATSAVGIALLVALVGPTTTLSANHGRAGTFDLASKLDGNGEYVAQPGVSGNVDLSNWRLTSDLAAGAPPRFRHETAGAQAASTLNNNVNAIVVYNGDLYVAGSFVNVAGIAAADFVARWDLTKWRALGSNGSVPHGGLRGEVQRIGMVRPRLKRIGEPADG